MIDDTMPAEALTVQQAVEILNLVRHDGYADWAIEDDGLSSMVVYNERRFYEFEAVAIAEKYQRERSVAPNQIHQRD